MNQTKPKPCPFCEGEEFGISVDEDSQVFLYCRGCFACLTGEDANGGDEENEDQNGTTAEDREKIIALWNLRPGVFSKTEVDELVKAAIATSQENEAKLTAKLHAAEEREAQLRMALEDVRDHNFPMGALPEDGLSNVSTFADNALSAAPEGRVEKLEKVATELLSLREQGFLENLPTIREEGIEADLNERFEPLLAALSNLAGEG